MRTPLRGGLLAIMATLLTGLVVVPGASAKPDGYAFGGGLDFTVPVAPAFEQVAPRLAARSDWVTGTVKRIAGAPLCAFEGDLRITDKWDDKYRARTWINLYKAKPFTEANRVKAWAFDNKTHTDRLVEFSASFAVADCPVWMERKLGRYNPRKTPSISPDPMVENLEL